ncbi:MAG: hypothetical protein FWC39_06210 [Bacteroidetes bacterium]|nr:hypothetical protein [Bacteroidota bacterium]
MAQIIAIVIALFFLCKIIQHRRTYKSLCWTFVGFLLLNGMIVVFSTPIEMPIQRWIILSLLFVIGIQKNAVRREWNSFPFKRLLIFLIICTFLIAVVDSRLTLFHKFYIPFNNVVETHLLLFAGYFAIKKPVDMQKTLNTLFIVLVFVGIYGIFNWVTRTNPYYEWVVENFFVGGDTYTFFKLRVLDASNDRFRAVSTFSATFVYGFVSSLFALLYFIYKSRKTYLKYIAVAAGFVGTLLCFSRTVLGAAFFASVVFIFLSASLTKMMKITLAALLVGICLYSFVPPIQETVDNTLDIFLTGGGKTMGSSIEMRQTQFLGAVKYFSQSPIFGNGYGYINNELGIGDLDNAILDEDMAGYESVIYNLMIEQGLIGLLCFFLLYGTLIAFFWRKRKVNKEIAVLGLAVVTLYLAFAIGTGTLGVTSITMLVVGAIIKTIVLNTPKREEIEDTDEIVPYEPIRIKIKPTKVPKMRLGLPKKVFRFNRGN